MSVEEHMQEVECSEPVSPRGKIKDIIAGVATRHNISYADMMGPYRFAHFVVARHAAMAELKRAFPLMSTPHIGKIFKRDHSTVLYVLQKMGVDTSQKTKREYELSLISAVQQKEVQDNENPKPTIE